MTATLSNSSASANPSATALRQTWDNSQFFLPGLTIRRSQPPQIRSKLRSLISAPPAPPSPELIETADTLPAEKDAELIASIRNIHEQQKTLRKKLGNLSTYIYTALSVDTQDAHANCWMPIIQKLSADLSEAMTPYSVFFAAIERSLYRRHAG